MSLKRIRKDQVYKEVAPLFKNNEDLKRFIVKHDFKVRFTITNIDENFMNVVEDTLRCLNDKQAKDKLTSYLEIDDKLLNKLKHHDLVRDDNYNIVDALLAKNTRLYILYNYFNQIYPNINSIVRKHVSNLSLNEQINRMSLYRYIKICKDSHYYDTDNATQDDLYSFWSLYSNDVDILLDDNAIDLV